MRETSLLGLLTSASVEINAGLEFRHVELYPRFLGLHDGVKGFRRVSAGAPTRCLKVASIMVLSSTSRTMIRNGQSAAVDLAGPP